MTNSPCILVDLPFCYLPYDHKVRLMIRKLNIAEKQRQECLKVWEFATQQRKGGARFIETGGSLYDL